MEQPSQDNTMRFDFENGTDDVNGRTRAITIQGPSVERVDLRAGTAFQTPDTPESSATQAGADRWTSKLKKFGYYSLASEARVSPVRTSMMNDLQ